MKTALLAACVATLVGAAGLLAARAEDKTLKSEGLPNPRPFVADDDTKLLPEFPKSGVIAGPKEWTRLWKVLGGENNPPKVDFDKELVLVVAGGGPNIINISPLTLSGTGDLKFGWSITERGGPGISVMFVKVSRAGVKTVNGKPLPTD